jgi:hypothetical protein
MNLPLKHRSVGASPAHVDAVAIADSMFLTLAAL